MRGDKGKWETDEMETDIETFDGSGEERQKKKMETN